MTDIRATFLAAGRAAVDLLARPEVAARWDQPSSLPHFTVGGLAGHLARAVTTVEGYLDREEPPAGDVVTAAGYYHAALGPSGAVDLDSDLHTAVRRRGEEAAAGGPEAVAGALRDLLARMEGRLAAEPGTRRIVVLHGLTLSLDDYLVTRVVELVVHMDDLAVSLDLPAPEPPAEAATVTIDALVRLARLRHGDLAVVRALARRERAAAGVLNVL